MTTSPRAVTHRSPRSNDSSCPTPALVHTRITHTRVTPKKHAFTYRGYSWLVDIDDLPRLPAPLRPFARFDADDHFPESPSAGATLRQRLDAHLRSAGVTPPGGRVVALMAARVAGYVFNPISVFWCHRSDGELDLVIAEVHNTYGERHTYLVRTDDLGRAEVDKEFYVSPFNDVSGHYRLSLPEPSPSGRVRVGITLDRPGEAPFVATLSGHATPATPVAVTLAQLRTPLAPLVVSARIRWHGIRLWLRRLPIQPRPDHLHHTTIPGRRPTR